MVRMCAGLVICPWQDDVAYIDSIAKGKLMTAEEEEDVIQIDQARCAYYG